MEMEELNESVNISPFRVGFLYTKVSRISTPETCIDVFVTAGTGPYVVCLVHILTWWKENHQTMAGHSGNLHVIVYLITTKFDGL